MVIDRGYRARLTSAHSDVALEMHLWTVGEAEHGEQCSIRRACVSIVYKFRHDSCFYGTPMDEKEGKEKKKGGTKFQDFP